VGLSGGWSRQTLNADPPLEAIVPMWSASDCSAKVIPTARIVWDRREIGQKWSRLVGQARLPWTFGTRHVRFPRPLARAHVRCSHVNTPGRVLGST